MEPNYQKDFLYFNQKNPPIYLDSAATSLTLKTVFAAMKKYASYYAINPHNHSSLLVEPTHQILAKVRQTTAKFLNAKNTTEISFVSSATYAANQVVFGLRQSIKPSHNIVLSADEHAANLLP